MDFADIKAQALKAREFVHRRGECSFTLRAPTANELRQVAREVGVSDIDDGAALGLVRYALVARCIVGWAGVRVRDVVAGSADAAPLPCSAQAMELLQDADPELAAELGDAVFERLRLRRDALEADAKNSPPSPPASAAGAALSALSG